MQLLCGGLVFRFLPLYKNPKLINRVCRFRKPHDVRKNNVELTCCRCATGMVIFPFLSSFVSSTTQPLRSSINCSTRVPTLKSSASFSNTIALISLGERRRLSCRERQISRTGPNQTARRP